MQIELFNAAIAYPGEDAPSGGGTAPYTDGEEDFTRLRYVAIDYGQMSNLLIDEPPHPPFPFPAVIISPSRCTVERDVVKGVVRYSLTAVLHFLFEASAPHPSIGTPSFEGDMTVSEQIGSYRDEMSSSLSSYRFDFGVITPIFNKPEGAFARAEWQVQEINFGVLTPPILDTTVVVERRVEEPYH